MRGKDLLDKMELVDPTFVEAADKPQNKKLRPLKWFAIAACLALAVSAGILLFPEKKPEISPDLPVLTITTPPVKAGGGTGITPLRDISDIDNENPWNEDCDLYTLPVFKNALTHERCYDFYHATNTDFDRMRELLFEVASDLGISPEEITITDDSQADIEKLLNSAKFTGVPESELDEYIAKRTTPTVFFGKTEGVEITVFNDLKVRITFDPAIPLPEKYNFKMYAPYEDIASASKYIEREYSELIDCADPKADISGDTYDIWLNFSYTLSFFESKGSLTDRIINYNFYQTKFYGNEEGDLWLVWLYRPDLSNKIGDYPIISADEALELLFNGNYVSNCLYDITGTETVVKTTLVYRYNTYDEYIIPFYCFYVEVPPDVAWYEENGLKTFGMYYVPAIESSYIANMPRWDGGFSY
ncbi:MAG: hypothetical protein IKM29_04135 [Clostridia bacterium]|nr:hypothetical protein [Clostridia bacterium]